MNRTATTEEEWGKILNELGARLHRREYDTEPEMAKKDWHFTHWFRKYGDAFFAFFRAQREFNAEQLLQWWKYRSTSGPKALAEPELAGRAWDDITRAWDTHLKSAALEEA